MTTQLPAPVAPEVATDYIADICLGLPELDRDLRAQVGRVEDLMLTALSEGEDFLTEPVLHLMNSGGKRFRPLVTALAAHSGDQPSADAVPAAAAAMEMVHLATLYHDDVMDESRMRRGVATVNARWSNTVAILSGDYLLARAGQLIYRATREAEDCVDKLNDTVATLVTGQMREATRSAGSYFAPDYLRTIQEKTASLISLSAWCGARLAGAPHETAARLERVGDLLGMVFQIADDILDLTVSTDQLGKTQGLDLREGVATLPVIYALTEDSAAGRNLAALLAEPVDDDEKLSRALELVHSTRGLERAEADMTGYVEQALALLGTLPVSPARTAWVRLLEYTATRTC
ncbi:polyprenyl synthetase family protein [Nocardia goodfellowii]